MKNARCATSNIIIVDLVLFLHLNGTSTHRSYSIVFCIFDLKLNALQKDRLKCDHAQFTYAKHLHRQLRSPRLLHVGKFLHGMEINEPCISNSRREEMTWISISLITRFIGSSNGSGSNRQRTIENRSNLSAPLKMLLCATNRKLHRFSH